MPILRHVHTSFAQSPLPDLQSKADIARVDMNWAVLPRGILPWAVPCRLPVRVTGFVDLPWAVAERLPVRYDHDDRAVALEKAVVTRPRAPPVKELHTRQGRCVVPV